MDPEKSARSKETRTVADEQFFGQLQAAQKAAENLKNPTVRTGLERFIDVSRNIARILDKLDSGF